MTPFERITVRLPHITLSGIARGSGPLALFFHGITANGNVWEPVIEGLAGSFRCVAFDQRGHGRSDKPRSGYLARDFANDIAAIVRHFRAGPALLVGHSLGARNALMAGALHPALVRGVVAIDFTPFIETGVFDALDARVGGGDRLFASLDAVRSYLAGRYPRLPPDAVARRAAHGYRKAAGGLRPLADPAAMRATSTGLRDDLVEAVRAIRVPTLLVRGADSKLVSPEAWQRTLALRPDLASVELPGADHYVPEEVPGAVIDAIRRFTGTQRVALGDRDARPGPDHSTRGDRHMATKDEPTRGIQWSAPVIVRKAADGLSVALPERVVAALRLGAGDVLNFTELPGGSIEVWMVPKSTYASLDAMDGMPTAGAAPDGGRAKGAKAARPAKATKAANAANATKATRGATGQGAKPARAAAGARSPRRTRRTSAKKSTARTGGVGK